MDAAITESVDPDFEIIDRLPTREALKLMLSAQIHAVRQVESCLDVMGAAVDAAVPRLRNGGRLIYGGAGTSARIAVQDGSELYPTFDWPTDSALFVVAGGPSALLRAVEGAEDDEEDARSQIRALDLGPNDVVISVAASGKTPFACGVLEEAARWGALRIAVTNNTGSRLERLAEFSIICVTGAEVIAGSTRMKAGTAQKIALNLLSTQIMIGLDKVYRGRMVDMRPSNDKLRARAVMMVADLMKTSPDFARSALMSADWNIKAACLLVGGVDEADTAAVLQKAGGGLRKALLAAGISEGDGFVD